MSEIPERVTRYRIDNGGFLQEHSRGNLVEITSAVPAIREQVLADAKARIEAQRWGHNPETPPRSNGVWNQAIDAALAALTQPQTERCPNPDCEGGTRPNGEGGWDLCPDCLEAADAAGGGAATAAGVADADLGLPLTNSTLVEEVVAAVYEACLDRAMGEEDASEVAAVLRGQLTGTRPTPTPYAKAFRERVCPVPEFPGIEKEES